jgi:hypothetical protein
VPEITYGRWSPTEVMERVLDGTWAAATLPIPLNLSPSLWLDASDTSTITQSGGAVSQWDNKGSLENFSQGTTSYQPTTGASTLNGLNVLDFNGDYMQSATASDYNFFFNGDSYLFAAVIQPGISSSPGALYGFCGNSLLSSSNSGASFFYEDTNPYDAFSHAVYRSVSSTYPVLNRPSNIITPNTFSVVSALADPDNATAADRSKIYINAGTANAINTRTDAVSTSNADRVFKIGSPGGSTQLLVGKIAEMIIVHGSEATEANRELLRDYLNEKWGVY